MSFKWLSQQDLQEAIGLGILDRIESFAPILQAQESNIIGIYKKKNLVSSDRFNDWSHPIA